MSRKRLMICDQCGNTRVDKCGSKGTGLELKAKCQRCGNENTVQHFQNTFDDIRGIKDAYLILRQRIENKEA